LIPTLFPNLDPESSESFQKASLKFPASFALRTQHAQIQSNSTKLINFSSALTICQESKAYI